MSELKKYDALPEWAPAKWEGGKPVPGPLPMWSGKEPPPAIDSDVIIKMNNLGKAKVVGYFVEDDWLGVMTKLYNPPAWYVTQNGGNVVGYAFGAEIKGV